MLIQHVRHPFNESRYIGTVVASKQDEIVTSGFSQCHPNDQFSKKIGRDIAIGRMKAGTSPDCTVPFIKYQPDGSKIRVDLVGDALEHVRSKITEVLVAEPS